METVIQGDSLGLNRRDNLPSKTTPLVDSHTFSGHNLLKPRVNQVTGCCATKVVINLSTSLVIPDYNKFFDGSPATFQPSYYQLDDGSLVTPPFAEDITGGSVNLLVLGILVAIFARNIAVSGDYIRRGKVKSKSLFYVLFASQILAPVSLLPMIASYFNQTINCTAVVIVSYLSSNISLAFLITGILGVKAYKCLNNSRLVLAVLALMQLASFGATIRDVTMTSGERRLSGSCIRKAGDPISVLIFVVIQFVESLFICCCFLFAYWKSRGSRTAKGRISLPASLAESPISPVSDEKAEGKKLRLKPRGWWDYVPNAQLSPRTQQASTRPPEPLHQAVRSKISGFISQRRNKKFTVPIKPKQQKRESIASDAGKLLNRQSLAASIHYTARPNSPTPSSFSRISKLIPNMVLFRKVMTDELLYTAFITATCVVVAVLVIIGVNFKNNLTVTGWVGTNWAIISLLTIHSFGRVVRRHEREALVQRCSDTSRTMRDKIGRAKRRTSSPQIRFRNDVPYSNQEDPFADVHGLRGPMTSWDSSVVSPSEPLPTDFPSDRRESTTSQATSNSSFLSTDKPLIPSAASSDIRSPFSETWLIDARSRDNLIEENISDTTRNGHGSQ